MTDYQVADWYAWVRNVESVFERSENDKQELEPTVKNSEVAPKSSSFSDLYFH